MLRKFEVALCEPVYLTDAEAKIYDEFVQSDRDVKNARNVPAKVFYVLYAHCYIKTDVAIDVISEVKKCGGNVEAYLPLPLLSADLLEKLLAGEYLTLARVTQLIVKREPNKTIKGQQLSYNTEIELAKFIYSSLMDGTIDPASFPKHVYLLNALLESILKKMIQLLRDNAFADDAREESIKNLRNSNDDDVKKIMADDEARIQQLEEETEKLVPIINQILLDGIKGEKTDVEKLRLALKEISLMVLVKEMVEMYLNFIEQNGVYAERVKVFILDLMKKVMSLENGSSNSVEVHGSVTIGSSKTDELRVSGKYLGNFGYFSALRQGSIVLQSMAEYQAPSVIFLLREKLSELIEKYSLNDTDCNLDDIYSAYSDTIDLIYSTMRSRLLNDVVERFLDARIAEIRALNFSVPKPPVVMVVQPAEERRGRTLEVQQDDKRGHSRSRSPRFKHRNSDELIPQQSHQQEESTQFLQVNKRK